MFPLHSMLIFYLILLAFYSFLKPDLGLSSGNKELNFVHKIRFLIFFASSALIELLWLFTEIESF